TPGNMGTGLTPGVNPTGASPNQLGVIRVDKPLTTPVFTLQLLNTGNIGGGSGVPAAPQAGATPDTNGPTLDTGDGRLLQAVWRGGNLYATTTVRPPSGPDKDQATAHWFRIDTTNPANLNIADQGDIGGEDIAPFTSTYYL